MFDFIEHTVCQHEQSTLLSMGMCKTFDSLKWEFIFKAFRSYRFGDNYKRCLETVCNTPKCIITCLLFSKFQLIFNKEILYHPQYLYYSTWQSTSDKRVVIDQQALKVAMVADDALLFYQVLIQVKLNPLVVVTNIQLFGFGLIESQNC